MFLSNLCMACQMAYFRAVCGLGTILVASNSETKESEGLDIKALLSDEGAAADGGALAPVKEAVQSYGGGSVSIARYAFIYIIGIAMFATAIGLAVHAGNPSKVADSKTAGGYRVGAAILGFASISILIFAKKIGEALFM